MTTTPSQEEINLWISTFKKWPIHIQNDVIKQLGISSFSNCLFKTNQQFEVPMPIEATNRQFNFKLIVKEFSNVEFIVEDYYATRMSLNQDRWTTPIIREDKFIGKIDQVREDALIIDCTYQSQQIQYISQTQTTKPITGKITFTIVKTNTDHFHHHDTQNVQRVLKLDMKETHIFDEIPKYKPYINDWKSHFGNAELVEIQLENVVSQPKTQGHGHHHDHDSSCCQ